MAPPTGPNASQPLTQQNVPNHLGHGAGFDKPTSADDAPPVYRAVELPLPPNALPSIQVKVASSRLRPVRSSTTGMRFLDDSSVYTLSICSRANGEELWRVEKGSSALPQLDQMLRPVCSHVPKLPDRKVLTGQSPAMIDNRRSFVDAYFEELLDTPMDEQAAAIFCQFLSTDTIDRSAEDGAQQPRSRDGKATPVLGPDGKPTKSGYLTKRGKNFGGWKSRYFVLENSELKYFEMPDGPHLGTVKLAHAQVGKQAANQFPTAAADDDENEYRHAFVILEPKKKDSASLVRHVLCAESDAERDGWVEAIVKHIEDPATVVDPSVPDATARTTTPSDTGPPTVPVVVSPELKTHGTESPSPPSTSSGVAGSSGGGDHEQSSSVKTLTISGPINGAVITDAGLWGNRSPAPPKDKDPEQRRRKLFSFKQRAPDPLGHGHSNSGDSFTSSLHAPRAPEGRENLKAVFGLPLAEAVEFCGPVGVGVDVKLPAVVYRCIEYLRKTDAASEEGIFRLSGSNVVIRALKERFNTEGDVDFLAEGQCYYDVHAVASLFKTYLRELPSTVLTRDLHLDFLHVLELDDAGRRVGAFHALVHRLPLANYTLLRALSEYLLEVVQKSDKNKMGLRNVGIVFSPTLNIPAPVFSMFLTDFDAIFGASRNPPSEATPVPLAADLLPTTTTTTTTTGAADLLPEDIRSPRRQMFTDLPTPAYNQTAFQRPPASATFPAPAAAAGAGGMHPSSSLAGLGMNSAGDLGFIPLQQSYETRNYSTVPRTLAPAPLRPQPSAQARADQNLDGRYGSLNRMMAPEDAATDKEKRRKSSMVFAG